MADFYKFPEERDRVWLEGDEAEALTREWLALDWSENVALAGDPYAGVEDDPAVWPAPPPTFVAPITPTGVHARGMRMRLRRETYGDEALPALGSALGQANPALIHPEHIMMALLWLGAMALGAWGWLA